MTNEQYHTLIHPYTDAMNLILTRLEILNHCAADNEDVRPIHGITHRIKEKISMENKLKKKHSNGSVQDARTLLKDIAGIRVICFFERDIYQLAESLKKQVLPLGSPTPAARVTTKGWRPSTLTLNGCVWRNVFRFVFVSTTSKRTSGLRAPLLQWWSLANKIATKARIRSSVKSIWKRWR